MLLKRTNTAALPDPPEGEVRLVINQAGVPVVIDENRVETPLGAVQGAGIQVTASRAALASDSGATLELSASVTYILTDAVALPAGVAFIGPASGSATIAVTGSATANGGTSSITVAAGKLATAVPRTSNAAAFIVAVQA